jgi:hypothetical protein
MCCSSVWCPDLPEQVNNTIVELEGLRRRSELDEVAQEAAAKVAAIARGQARKLRWVLFGSWLLDVIPAVCCLLSLLSATTSCCLLLPPPRCCRRPAGLPATGAAGSGWVGRKSAGVTTPANHTAVQFSSVGDEDQCAQAEQLPEQK